MAHLLQVTRPKTFIQRIPRKGRGLFAKRAIQEGEMIEACQLILMDDKDVSRGIEGYVFKYSRNKTALALGNGSLLNHDEDPNAECSFDYTHQLLIITAVKPIRKGEEITINYGYSPEHKKKFGIS